MPPVSPRQIVPLMLALLLLFFLPRTKRLRVRLTMVTAMILLGVLAGCSGPGGPTVKPINGSVTIKGQSTGSAGTVSHSSGAINFTLD